MRHSTARRSLGGPSGAVSAQRATADMAPVFTRPRPSTSIAATVTVAVLLRPETASAGEMTPANRSTTGIPSATWSIR